MISAAVCLIVKNEAKYMVEWIAHYLALGFDEIFVYDNGSTDNTFSVMESLARRERCIRLKAWPDVAGEVPQITAYNDAAGLVESDWLAFFDADELLVLKRHACIQDFLARYPAQAGAVAINWQLFGSSGALDYVDELQSVRFRRCTRDEPLTKNRHVKSIVRVGSIVQASSHIASLKPGYLYYDEQVEPVGIIEGAKTVVPTHVVSQLNHYVVRSAQEFREKRARGNVARVSDAADKFGRDDAFWRSHDRNDQEDSSIDPWIDRAGHIRSRLRYHLAEDGVSTRR